MKKSKKEKKKNELLFCPCSMIIRAHMLHFRIAIMAEPK